MDNRFYTMKIAGLERNLPLCRLNDELYIAGFVMFGDVEITVACAGELLRLAPEYDIMITAESKGIPLIHEMARQSGKNTYILARKGSKVYMGDVVTVKVNSITTLKEQVLCLSRTDADAMRGKRVLIVDDVISTGASLAALETLVEQCGGNVVGKMAVLAEGDAINRPDITALAPLPLFNPDGTVKE